ncbi:MAG TPA: DUF6364 family protein [Cryomorphaceae bacterium]|nr:DUF6364 family protein [Cryomorphaceae bacterium]
MNTKLTLTIEKEVIDRAKKYAKEEKRSLSDIIENYLKMLTQSKSELNANEQELNPLVASLRGSFKMPKDMDYQKELNKRREDKYS